MPNPQPNIAALSDAERVELLHATFKGRFDLIDCIRIDRVAVEASLEMLKVLEKHCGHLNGPVAFAAGIWTTRFFSAVSLDAAQRSLETSAAGRATGQNPPAENGEAK